MNRERFSGLSAFIVATDALVIVISFFLAHFLVDSLKQFLPDPYQARQLYETSHYGWVMVYDLAMSLALLYLFGFYTYGRTLTLFDTFLNLGKATVVGFLLLIAVLFLLRIQDVSRLLLGVYALVKLLLLFGAKGLLKYVLGKLQEHGYNQINALVIGAGDQAGRLIDRLRSQPDMGYRLIGVLAPDPAKTGSRFHEVPVIGRVGELYDVLLNYSADEVFYAMGPKEVEDLNALVFACEEVGVRFSVLADWFKPNIARTSLRALGETPLLTFSTTPSQIGQLLLKNVMDKVATVILLIVLSPLLAAIALAIKLTSPGPVLFAQLRSGLNGRVFKFYKFRTMVENAEELKKDLEHRNEMSGPVFKIKDDPRVTPLGRILRKYSLDELPQLFNVLRGDMSLVGPRPPIPAEVVKYERWQRRRLSMKPGLTCFWQIGGRNEIDFGDWMTMDLRYIDNWSFRLDVIILLKTIPVVLFGRGGR
ncbi:MAG TPA: sugar transferase [bacterium]|nr:sugar transferase [bacterium]